MLEFSSDTPVAGFSRALLRGAAVDDEGLVELNLGFDATRTGDPSLGIPDRISIRWEHLEFDRLSASSLQSRRKHDVDARDKWGMTPKSDST